jgi:hypothetical protein
VDDALAPECLEEVVLALEKHPGAHVLYTDIPTKTASTMLARDSSRFSNQTGLPTIC